MNETTDSIEDGLLVGMESIAGRTPFSIDDDDDDDDQDYGVKVEQQTNHLVSEGRGERSESISDGTKVISIARIAALILEDDDDDDEGQHGGLNDDDFQGSNNSNDGRAQREQDQNNNEGQQNVTDTANTPEAVPFSQFQNALTVIQDLEARLQAVEERNRILEHETVEKQRMIEAYEQKLQEFPKLIEDAVKEGDRQAAAAVAVASKESFWKEYMNRQEEQERKKIELEKKKGKGGRPYSNLRQSDFLRDLVVAKQEEKKHGRFWSKAVNAAKGKRTGNTQLEGGEDDRKSGESATTNDGFLSSDIQVLNLLS